SRIAHECIVQCAVAKTYGGSGRRKPCQIISEEQIMFGQICRISNKSDGIPAGASDLVRFEYTVVGIISENDSGGTWNCIRCRQRGDHLHRVSFDDGAIIIVNEDPVCDAGVRIRNHVRKWTRLDEILFDGEVYRAGGINAVSRPVSEDI